MIVPIETVVSLANLYNSCINEMSQAKEIKTNLQQVSKTYHNDVNSVNSKISNIAKDIRSEQIRYRKFDNYLRKVSYKGSITNCLEYLKEYKHE